MEIKGLGSLVYAVQLTGELKRPVLTRGRGGKKREGLEYKPSESASLKIGSKLSILALLSSTKLCLCSLFQGTPGVLASILCA